MIRHIYKSFLEGLITLLFLLTNASLVPAQDSSGLNIAPKVAVVLSGGGAKGFAHIGALKVLEEEGIPIDMIVGTSIGSLIGGFYSIGYSAAEIESIVNQQDWDVVLSDDVSRLLLTKHDQELKQRYLFSLPLDSQKKLSLPQAVRKGQNVINLFCRLAGNVPADVDFSTFPIFFACVATNLETGEEVVLDKGFLPTAMYASMAIPGVFSPLERDSMILVDGGVVNNFPVDVAKKMGADIVIGIDIRGDYYERDQLKSLGEIIGNLINFYSKTKDDDNKKQCNLIIRPDVTGYSAGSFTQEATDTLIYRGEQAAGQLRDQIRRIKEQYHLKPREKSRDLVTSGKLRITEVKYEGEKNLNKAFLEKTLNLPLSERYSYDEIKNAVDRLYGTGGFDKVYFYLSDNEKGKTLHLIISSKEFRAQSIGFRVNTKDAAALLLNATWKDYSRTIGLFSISTELSANPGLSIIAEMNRRNFPDFGFELKGKFQNYSIYENRDKTVDADLFYISSSLYAGQQLKNWRLGISVQHEYFVGDLFQRGSDTLLAFDRSTFWLANGYAYISFDNMDHFYFPEKGTRLYLEFSINSDLKNDGVFSPNLLLTMNNVIPISKKTALLFDWHGRGTFRPEYPLIKTTLIGGEPYSHYFNYHFPFMGLPPVYLADRFSFVALAGLRFRLSSSQYFSLIFNTLQQSNNMYEINLNRAVYGGGVKYSLKTVVGPMDIGLGYADLHRKPTVSANLGYWF